MGRLSCSVAGPLLVGHVAAEDGLFQAAGASLSRLPGGPIWLYTPGS